MCRRRKHPPSCLTPKPAPCANGGLLADLADSLWEKANGTRGTPQGQLTCVCVSPHSIRDTCTTIITESLAYAVSTHVPATPRHALRQHTDAPLPG